MKLKYATGIDQFTNTHTHTHTGMFFYSPMSFQAGIPLQSPIKDNQRVYLVSLVNDISTVHGYLMPNLIHMNFKLMVSW